MGDTWATYAGSQTLNVTTTFGNVNVTLTSGDTARMVVGQLITGNANIPDGATIASITGTTTFTLSLPVAASATGTSTTFAQSGVVALDANSSPPSTEPPPPSHRPLMPTSPPRP